MTKQLESLKSSKFKTLSIESARNIVGGIDPANTGDWCETPTGSGSRWVSANGPDPIKVTWKTDVIFSDGNGERMGAVYRQQMEIAGGLQ